MKLKTNKFATLLMTLGVLAATLGHTSISYGQDVASADDATSQEAQPPLATITGSGKAGYIPLWHSASTIADSNIFQSTTGTTKNYVGVGTTDPTSPFQVNAAVPNSFGYLALFSNSTADINTILSVQSPNGQTNIGVDQNGGSYLYSSKASIYFGPDGTNTLWVGNFGCGNTCNGYVGMQTSTPQNPLDVAGSVAIGSYGGVNAAPSDGLIVSGFVGVGTNAPDTNLSVVGGADKTGGGSWATYSDGRLKNLDGDFTAGLDQVLKLHAVRYRYKAENALGIHDPEEHIGFVAQDVQKVIPEAVTENKQGYLLVNNDPIILAMLNGIKEQQAMIGKLQEQINEQKAKSKIQQAEIKHLSSQVRTMQASLHTGGRTKPEVHTTKLQYQ